MLAASPAEASARRPQLARDLCRGEEAATGRVRVGGFAQSWIKSKAVAVDDGTGQLYADVLDKYVLPVFGDFFLDALRRSDVQEWVTTSLTTPRWKGEGKKRKQLPPYSVRTVHGWFRVLRTMIRDALDEHGLDHDPTSRIKFPPMPEPTEPKSITAGQLGRFLDAMRTDFPQHYALTVVMSYTGMRFCHASALRWEDFVETQDGQVLYVRRKQVRGAVGNVSRKKGAPRVFPLPKPIAEVLTAERKRMLIVQAAGVETGYMFPSSAGTLRQPSSLRKAWAACSKAAGIYHRFTVHGTRYTFTDLGRRAGVKDEVVRSLTGHVTVEMQSHYSHIGLDEQRAAVGAVLTLVPLGTAAGADQGADHAGSEDKSA